MINKFYVKKIIKTEILGLVNTWHMSIMLLDF